MIAFQNQKFVGDTNHLVRVKYRMGFRDVLGTIKIADHFRMDRPVCSRTDSCTRSFFPIISISWVGQIEVHLMLDLYFRTSASNFELLVLLELDLRDAYYNENKVSDAELLLR